MKVLILRSNPVAPDPRVEKNAQALHAAGYEVKILGWDRSGQLPALENREFASIRRLGIKADYGSGLANLPALLRWQLGLLLALLREKYDIIHACDFDTVLPALLAKIIRKKILIYDIFDFYADMLRKVPQWIKQIIRKVDLWVIGQADAVIIVDQSRQQQIAGSKPRRLAVIYNSPPEGRKLLPSGKEGPFTIGYVGLLQKERGLLPMIEVVGCHPEWRLELAGFGGDEAEIRQAAQKYSNIVFHGTVDYEQALALSARADVLFATYDPAIPNHVYASPNKLFEAMMLGKPIIVSEGIGCAEIVKEWQNGVVVPYGDTVALEQAISRLAADGGMRQTMANNARRAYRECYSWKRMEQRLIDLYRQLGRRNRFR